MVQSTPGTRLTPFCRKLSHQHQVLLAAALFSMNFCCFDWLHSLQPAKKLHWIELFCLLLPHCKCFSVPHVLSNFYSFSWLEGAILVRIQQPKGSFPAIPSRPPSPTACTWHRVSASTCTRSFPPLLGAGCSSARWVWLPWLRSQHQNERLQGQVWYLNKITHSNNQFEQASKQTSGAFMLFRRQTFDSGLHEVSREDQSCLCTCVRVTAHSLATI